MMRRTVAIAILAIAIHASADVSRTTADAAFQQKDWDSAVKLYEAWLATHPNDGQAWYRLGMSRHGAGNELAAVEALERAWGLHFAPPYTAYNLAAIDSLAAKKDEAFAWLEKAIAAGFHDAKGLQNDTDFANVRDDARFASILAEIDRRAHPCRGVEGYRTLDFWIGDWKVSDTRSGTPVGTSKVQSILDGCVVFEQWTGAEGMTGKSFNSFDPKSARWKQSWVDSTGEAYEFSGEPSTGRLVYEREVAPSSKNRMALSKNADGSVRQVSEMSDDGGLTWKPQYDFTYRHGASPVSHTSVEP